MRSDPPSDLFNDLRRVTVLAGNPPYVRYQSFTGAQRLLALTRAAAAGEHLSQLSSAWARFVVHATTFIDRGGRLALVLPAELVHASYAEPVRQYLRRTFRSVTVVHFEQHVFPESQERVVLLLADEKGGSERGDLNIISVQHPRQLADFAEIDPPKTHFSRQADPVKWEVCADDRADDVSSPPVLWTRRMPSEQPGSLILQAWWWMGLA